MSDASTPSALLCSVDGRITPVADASVPIADHGFLRGDGAFEVMRLYGNRPFGFTDHMKRLEHSCAGIFLEWDRDTFETEIAALLAANESPEAAMRLVVSRGGRRIAMLEHFPAFEHGLRMSSVEYQPTVVLNGLKTLSYAGNMLATRLAQRDGADEALLVRPDGTVLEAPTSTVFWTAPDGTLRTPTVDTGVLASITRQRILELVPVDEDDKYQLTDLLNAQEVFIASSLREVQGVASLDGLDFACPGTVTERIAGMLAERIQAELAQPAGMAGKGSA